MSTSPGGGSKILHLGPHDSDQARKEYARILAELTANGGVLVPRGYGQTSVNVFCAAYLEWAQDYHGWDEARRQIARITSALKPVIEIYGHVPLSEFGPVALSVCRDWFVAKGYARTYCNTLTASIRRAWRWGVEKELVQRSWYEALGDLQPLRKGHTTAPEREPVKDVDLATVERTLPYLLPQTQAMVRLQQLTGMRPGEVVLMRPCDIDQEGLLVGGARVWVYRPVRHKGQHLGIVRAVALGPKAQEALTPWLDRKPESYCFSPREAMIAWLKKRGRKLDPNRARAPGDMYRVHSYEHAIRRACKKAGVTPWHPHQLRHHTATLIDAEEDLERARAVLGHTSVEMTRLYSHAEIVKAARVAARLG
ncbi:MAG: site-specific integrase [Gemmataceae bacterium]|nr:site-specific integrase [Gemmataceae bacterium]